MQAPDSLFRAIVLPNPTAQKVLFYLTSYYFPWWVYRVPIAYFRRKGYEVVAYEFDNRLLENDDPHLLPRTILAYVADMSRHQQAYRARGVEVFHGIGNSLGSYLLFNYALRQPLDALIFNGGGSIADVVYHHARAPWRTVADAYRAKGFDREAIRTLWADFDEPTLGKTIQTERMLITWSRWDGTIPRTSSEGFIAGLRSSGKPLQVRTDSLPHVISVGNNAHKIKLLYRFLNPPDTKNLAK